MKTSLLSICVLFICLYSQAQTLFCTTVNDDGLATINKFFPATNSLIVVHTFSRLPSEPCNTNGSMPSASLVQAIDGNLYGMTMAGGNCALGYGVIFSFDPVNSTYKKIHDFDKINGMYARGSLIQASDGKLYGMTNLGGKMDYGVIFSFDPLTSVFKKLMDFNGYNGAYPDGSLMQAKDGKLYGMTAYGGGNGLGLIFSFDPLNSTYKKILDFDGLNGAKPSGSLIQATDGNLYGMTTYGGTNNQGVIFSYNLGNSTYKKFNDNYYNNGFPYGSLTEAKDGKLYGLSSSGALFSLDPISSAFTVVFVFSGPDGLVPEGNLFQASDGLLYGLTNRGGGINSLGVIFSFDPISLNFKKLQDFDGTNGGNPFIGSTFMELKTPNVNIAPNVKIVSPFDESYYYSPAKITITASATDDDGSISKVEFYNGSILLTTEKIFPYSWEWKDAPQGYNTITAKAYDNKGLATISQPITITILKNNPPDVKIISPIYNSVYPASSTINIKAIATDYNGAVKSVKFYSDTTLLHTENYAGYSWTWKNVAPGDYTITAVATDNYGLQTTSSPVHITVINQPPTVTITTPTDGASYAGPASFYITADAHDADGKIKQVEFYSGTTLLRTERYAAYKWLWKDVAPGTYTITAKAIDNWGAETISAPVTVTVTASGELMVSSRPAISKNALITNQLMAIKVSPNPATNHLTLATTGLQRNTPSIISIVSSSGVTMKTIKTADINQTISLNVSSLTSGVYTLKIINGKQVMYKKFVKL